MIVPAFLVSRINRSCARFKGFPRNTSGSGRHLQRPMWTINDHQPGAEVEQFFEIVCSHNIGMSYPKRSAIEFTRQGIPYTCVEIEESTTWCGCQTYTVTI